MQIKSTVSQQGRAKKRFCDYTVANAKYRSVDEQADEIRRELEVRRRIYDRWVSEGKVSWTEAHDRMERLLSTLATLVSVTTQPADELAEMEGTTATVAAEHPPTTPARENPEDIQAEHTF